MRSADNEVKNVRFILLINIIGVWGVAPSRVRAAAPHSAPFPGKGVFGKDAEIRTHQALSMDAYKWSNKVGAGRTDNKRPLLHRSKANRVS